MPSLHTAWIVMWLWFAAPAPRWSRPLQWVFAGLTLFYALSAGGHYLCDLIVAVPFTVAMKFAARREWRSTAFAVNAAMVALWLILLRFGTSAFQGTWMLPYGLTLATLWISYRSNRPRIEETHPALADIRTLPSPS